MKKILQLLIFLLLAITAYFYFMPTIVEQKEAEFQEAGVDTNIFEDFKQFVP